MLPLDGPKPKPTPRARFATTRWSLVLAARERTSPRAREALSDLCQLYWYPLYSFVRRQGYGAEDAQDLTQGFFTRLLEKDYLAEVDPGKGRFRSFLLVACKHYLANERDRVRARKRGGGFRIVSIDFQDAEARYRREPAHALTPEKLFERRWALTLLDRVLGQVRQDFAVTGRDKLFDRLKVFLTGDEGPGQYRAIAHEAAMSEGAVKVAVHRLRRHYRERLRQEISQTVADPREIGRELGYLLGALECPAPSGQT